MAKHRFRLMFEGEAVIELDDAVIDAVTDEWRSKFYQLNSPECGVCVKHCECED